MEQITYSLKELCRAAGVTERTVRFYIQEGLLPPPQGSRSASRYVYEHWLRLEVILKLKENYLPLREIKTRLEHITVPELEQMARENGWLENGENHPPTDEDFAIQPDSEATATPLLYLKLAHPEQSDRAFGFGQSGLKMSQSNGQKQELVNTVEFTPRNQVFKPFSRPPLLERDADPEPPAPQFWERITVAPGVELHVDSEIFERHRGSIMVMLREMRRLLKE
jgi:DNA-binding transcriptional MerR regulator